MNEKATWRAPELGPARELDLPGGRIRVHERGNGPVLVFAHGLLVNANLWRKVVERLAPDFRCVTLDLPLGSHVVPAGAQLDPPKVAALIAEALDALELEDVTLVGNDTGGALAQMVVTTRPERVGRLVLTPCDYRDNFPPSLFNYFRWLNPIPGAIAAALAPLRLRPLRRLPIAYGWLTKRPIDRPAEDSYVGPAMSSAAIRRDVHSLIAGLSPSQTNAAADRLGTFERPALIAWASEEKLFPVSDAEALARDLPDSRLELIDDSYTFVMEDRPERLAELIAGFVREPAKAVT